MKTRKELIEDYRKFEDWAENVINRNYKNGIDSNALIKELESRAAYIIDNVPSDVVKAFNDNVDQNHKNFK